MERFGKGIILIGIGIIIIGVVVWLFGDRLRFLGRLPGDIRIEKEHVHVYIPITTMILVSVLLSAVLWLVQKMMR